MDDDVWPLFGLEIVTPHLRMRPPRDEDFPALLEAVDAGIHDPATMPFAVPWTDAEPAARRRNAVQHWWSTRASFHADDWQLSFAVFLDGRAIGIQGLMATSFPTLRAVSTGSWLTRDAQGRRLGREMRAAVLTFAFDVLGADVALSGAFSDNPASLAVSRALGYEANGVRSMVRRGVAAEMLDLRLTRERWFAWKPDLDVEVHGFEACRAMFEPGKSARQ